jgi:class 3 adenylate cyclase
MDVGDWLRGLGLGQYEAAFRESEIEADVLAELTDQHLKDLGVSLGNRLRILRAIRDLSVAAPAPDEVAARPAQEPLDSAERRQLTVMFCDLVGSTALSARLDPEDMRAIIATYHKCCASLIERGGGFVAKYMGDGVLAYFGYPQSHEHDAERAVRAGLAIVEAAPKLETAGGAPLRVRVGIATGIVVVGDLLGSGESQERGVVGDTPNLAARLQSSAAPDSVVIAEGTRKLLGNLFELQDLGRLDLKGVAGPTRAFAALRAGSQESRFEALHADGLTALVGREEEGDLLQRRWAKAKAGEGQVVLLSGEAGIGKSRLTAAFLEGWRARRIHACDTSARRNTRIARSTQLSATWNARPDMRARTTREESSTSDALLTQSATSREDAALFADMLSLPNDGRYPVVKFAPQVRQRPWRR